MAKHNLGSALSALALEAGSLISADVQVIRREVSVPGGLGKQMMDLRVSGVASFLAAKAAALQGRDKPKDAYDIVWLLEAWPGAPLGRPRLCESRQCSGESNSTVRWISSATSLAILTAPARGPMRDSSATEEATRTC